MIRAIVFASEPGDQLSMVASVAHDLRNPLAAIQGSAEMLITSILSQGLARNIYCAAIRMRDLLEELLEQSGNIDREVEVCDLHELVTRAGEVAATAESQAVQIGRVVPDGLFIVLDRRRIHRVLVNLLVNALEAMPHGGSVHISAVSDQTSVLIRVSDSGPGIANEIKHRLFQPFATAGKSRMASVWVLPCQSRLCSITAATCGRSRPPKAHALRFACRWLPECARRRAVRKVA